MKRESLIGVINGLLLVILLIFPLLGLFQFPLIFSYTWHKILHIIGAVLFFGNMIVGPVWVSYAIFTEEERIIDFSFKLLKITDILLTIVGLDLMIINGLCLSSVFGGLKTMNWIFYSVLLLFAMWILSLPVIFIQEKLYTAFETKGFQSKEFKKYLKLWAIFGTIVTIPPSLVFYLMISKNV